MYDLGGDVLSIIKLEWGPMIPDFLLRQLEAAAALVRKKQARAAKRETKSIQYAQAGLNGKRAVARRLRQIEAGGDLGWDGAQSGATLRAANGLVSL
jgi:hypothetical protein